MQSHGSISKKWKANVLIINSEGPFNDEGIIQVIDEIKKSVISKKLRNWLRIEIWDDNTLGSPSVMKCAEDYNVWCSKNGCKATAIVVSNSVQKNLIERTSLGNIKIFNSTNKATDWIKECAL
ncbi:MAG: hypothetical protein ACJAXS_000485 [Colwellia sp.]|jgi:hypothetical protein